MPRPYKAEPAISARVATASFNRQLAPQRAQNERAKNVPCIDKPKIPSTGRTMLAGACLHVIYV